MKTKVYNEIEYKYMVKILKKLKMKKNRKYFSDYFVEVEELKPNLYKLVINYEINGG